MDKTDKRDHFTTGVSIADEPHKLLYVQADVTWFVEL